MMTNTFQSSKVVFSLNCDDGLCPESLSFCHSCFTSTSTWNIFEEFAINTYIMILFPSDEEKQIHLFFLVCFIIYSVKVF
jgi:hypothetical protein